MSTEPEQTEDDFQKELIELFGQEAQEWLIQIHSALTELESQPDTDRHVQLVDAVVRGITSLGGSAATVNLPVLLISGIVNEEVSRQAESCKADGVLKKPFQGSSLKDRVLDLLTKRPQKPAPIPEMPQPQTAVESSFVAEVCVVPAMPVPEEIAAPRVEAQEHRTGWVSRRDSHHHTFFAAAQTHLGAQRVDRELLDQSFHDFTGKRRTLRIQ